MKFFLIQQGPYAKKHTFGSAGRWLGSVRSPCLGLAWLPGGVLLTTEREVRLSRVSRDFQFGRGASSKSGAIHRDVRVGPDGLV